MQYKCPNCGGAIEFDSTSGQMKCPFCDTNLDIEALRAYDESLKQTPPDQMEWNMQSEQTWNDDESAGMKSYLCQSCGGEIVADEQAAATSCPFCGNPVILMGNLSGQLRPDYIIPFKLDKKAAKEALANHLKKKPLLPKFFKTEQHIDDIKGIYVPFWLFDADVNANIFYRATRVRSWRSGDYNCTETSHYSINRAGTIGFDHVPADGSTKMDDTLMESIEPFDYREAVDFQTAYLSGYLADKYDVEALLCQDHCNERMKKSTEAAFMGTVQGYSSVRVDNSNVNISNGKISYALLPVWTLNTTWQDKKFTFAMNGQTGKFVGNLPISWGRFWSWLLGITIGGGTLLSAIVSVFNLVSS